MIRQFCVYADCLSYPNIPSKKHESEVKKSKKTFLLQFLIKKHNRGLIPFQCVFPNSNFFIYLQMKKILLGVLCMKMRSKVLSIVGTIGCIVMSHNITNFNQCISVRMQVVTVMWIKR